MAINVLDQFAADCYGLALEKGFWDDLSPSEADPKKILAKKFEKLALILSEGGEAIEAIRKPGPSEHVPMFTSEEEELADVLIRVLDYCGGFNLRIGAAFVAKMEYNKSRPHKHGKLA